MKIVVSGYRYYNNEEFIKSELLKLNPTEVVVGDCKGVDSCVVKICSEHNIKCTVFKADWAKYGPAAGPIHNRQMLETNPDIALIFISPLSKGTLNMLNECKKRTVKTVVYNI